ncbi:MAG: UvrD-helicase domain-containing protein [Porticoccaceae bacterium]
MNIADASQRTLALDPNRSFAVAAPAGSGKTELLTQRVLRLLATVDAPEEILCMTFTRKAAGEMRQRIIQALRKAARGEQPGSEHQRVTQELAQAALERDRELDWQLLHSPNRLRILTIDGFCLNLARQLALESGFGEQLEPLDNPDPHYRQVIGELLLPALEKQHELGRAVAALLNHLDNDLNRLEALLLELLQKREQWLGHMYQARNARAYLEHFLGATSEEVLGKAYHLLAPFGSDLALLADYAANQLPDDKKHLAISNCRGLAGLPTAQAPSLPQWLGLCELLLTGQNDWRARLDKNIGFPTDINGDKTSAKARKEAMTALLAALQEVPGLRDCLEDIRFLPGDTYPDSQWDVLNALCQLLPTLAALLSVHFQQHRVCDFTEITLAALRALGNDEEPSELALKLDYRIRHILTDEFQDTSSIQFEILKRLTAGWQPGDGHSLFIVGDAMQSLYGFRNANVGLFLEARSMPIGQLQLEPLDLQVNFRSQAGLIDWVNQRFPEVFPAEENIGRGAVPYSQASAVHPPLPAAAVTLDAFVDFPDGSAEAERVVELVAQAKQHDPEASIAILVRNRTHLTDILAALQQAGHRWQATDIDPLSNRMPVIDLMSLTRALLSPADRIAWLSILRAPWCGLDLADLLALSKSAPPDGDDPSHSKNRFPLLLQRLTMADQLPGLSTAGQTILQRVAPVLIQAWQQRQRKPLRCWIEGTWLALGGPQALSSSTDYEQCQQYLALLEKHDSAGTIADWPSFEKAVQSLYARPDQNADPNLHVMTIHKAKGLEFDTVILPGLNRRPRSDDAQLLLWQEQVGSDGENRLLIGPPAKTGEDADDLYRYLDRERKLKTRLETARVLYVAVTRAISRLHLLYNIKEDTAPAANSLLASLWPAIQQDVEQSSEGIHCHKYQESTSGQNKTASVMPTLTNIRRLPPQWMPPHQPQRSSAAAEGPAGSSLTTGTNASGREADLDYSARHTGTVLHRILRQITLEGLEQWSQATIRERLPFWEVQLRQLGLVETAEPLQRLQQAVSNCLGDDTARWLLDHRHPRSHCEFPLGYSGADGTTRTAIVDRTFVYDDTRWIIDYKSAEPTEDESLEQFLWRQRTHYREQLDHYARLFSAMEELPVKCALYFPLIQKIDIL